MVIYNFRSWEEFFIIAILGQYFYTELYYNYRCGLQNTYYHSQWSQDKAPNMGHRRTRTIQNHYIDVS